VLPPFPPLRNRGLGPLAETVLPILLARRPAATTNKHFDDAKSRDRVLADRELAIVWHALPDSDYGAIVKLLILTGQRREEIGALRRSEVDLEELVIALPPERTKNGRPHEVPLSKPALAILSAFVSADLIARGLCSAAAVRCARSPERPPAVFLLGRTHHRNGDCGCEPAHQLTVVARMGQIGKLGLDPGSRAAAKKAPRERG
jgi:integrase